MNANNEMSGGPSRMAKVLKPSQSMTCSVCAGKGTVVTMKRTSFAIRGRCPNCNGFGKTVSGEQCPDCIGTGQEAVGVDNEGEMYTQACPSCNGSGKNQFVAK